MYTLVTTLQSGLTQKFNLENTLYTIGRSKNCDISFIENNFISRVHCSLIMSEENGSTFCLLIDGNLITREPSFNGTWVNGRLINKSVRLNHQDEITFGVGSSFPKLTFYIDELDNGGDTIQHEKEV